MKKNKFGIIEIIIIIVIIILLIMIGKQYIDNQKVIKNAINTQNLPKIDLTNLETFQGVRNGALNGSTAFSVNNDSEKKIDQEILELQKKYNNTEIIGRLYIPGTNIDYPVAHKADDLPNNDYYLHKDLNGNYLESGTLYLDTQDDVNREDKNTIIYGHQMAAPIMFHDLRFYNKKDYLEEHKTVVFQTLYGTYVYDAVSFMKTLYTFRYDTVFFRSDDEYNEMLKGIESRAEYPLDESLAMEDNVLNLSTCDLDTSNDLYRFVVTCKLIKKYPPGTGITLDNINNN